MSKLMQNAVSWVERPQQKSSIPPEAFGKVAVLFGGRSAEREISLRSGQSVLDALIRQGVNAHPIDPRERLTEQLQAGAFDRAFIVLHGPEGEDGVIQGYLQMLGIPFTGSNVASSALTMDKARAKLVMDGFHIPTPPFGVAHTVEQAHEIAQKLGFPVSIKPIFEGSSIGVSRVNNVDELPQAYDMARAYGEVMVEKWIIGRDLSVSVVGDQTFSPLEVKAHNAFFDFAAKYESKETEFICPAALTPDQEQQVRALGYQAFCALGCAHWGRVDLMLDEKGQAWVLEVNTIPGMTAMSQLPRAARTGGLEFDALVVHILSLTLDKAHLASMAREA